MVLIKEVNQVTQELCEAFQLLIPQLTSSSEVPRRKEIESIIEADVTRLLIAVDDTKDAERIVGALTLVIYRIPTGYIARIEDVVVEQCIRRQGIGELLMQTALQYARKAGVKAVDLTSNPDRIAANQLYLKMGFEKRRTNLYRYLVSAKELET